MVVYFLVQLQILGEFSLSLVIVFTAVFNLNCSLVLNSSLSFMFFHRVKEPKRPAQNKISHNSLLLTSRKRHPSVGCCLPLKASRCHSCAPELVLFSVINNNITLPHFKHVLACSLNVNGLQL